MSEEILQKPFEIFLLNSAKNSMFALKKKKSHISNFLFLCMCACRPNRTLSFFSQLEERTQKTLPGYQIEQPGRLKKIKIRCVLLLWSSE